MPHFSHDGGEHLTRSHDLAPADQSAERAGFLHDLPGHELPWHDGHPLDPVEAELGAAASYPGAPGGIGNPAEYHQYWFFQQHNGYCAPSSVTQVIEAQTGMTIRNYHLVEQEAARLGIPATGLTMSQTQELLNGFNIPSHIEYAGNPEAAAHDLAAYLQQGRNVILGVNASPIWYGTQDSAGNPHGQADHALVVTAVDTQTGTVTLSDPGSPTGNEEHVPFNVFMEAWSASGYGMVVTDDPVGGADHAAATAAVHNLAQTAGAAPQAPASAPVPAVLLPVALASGWAAYRARRSAT